MPFPAPAPAELTSSGASGALPVEARGSAREQNPELQGDARLASLPAHLEPLRVLGQGGSSVVYEALHTRLKVKVAVKLLTIQGPHADQAQKRMLREAELYALLDDPRIPRVYDVNELPDGTPYVVMEMVPGESLEELLAKRGVLSTDHALGIAREVLLTLASVHERGVLHRDVKPANVILSWSSVGPCEVRLVDFGIAKLSTRGSGEEAVTQRGTLIGTPHYMAAECLAGHPANVSTDVYSVGIMLYEMLAGAVPFSGASLPAIMSAVMRQEPRPLHERNAGVSAELSALVMKAMAREPAARFASAREMLAAIAVLLPVTAQPAALEPTELPRVNGRAPLLFLAALLSTLLVATGFLLAGSPRWLRADAEPPRAAEAVEATSLDLPALSAGNQIVPTSSVSASPLQREAGPGPAEQEPSNDERELRVKRRHHRHASSAAEAPSDDEPATYVRSLPANPY